MPEVVLSADRLTKRFGKRLAVADVSFEVFAGEVFGFLGPNGAGKTTTIRMLVGLARPDSGFIRIRGLDLSHNFREAMSHVGCIVESPDLYKYLTGRENLQHFARMLPEDAAARIPGIARLVSLEERLDDRVSTYSLGMRQRLGIAQALLGNPDLLILDEPANGLDPAGIREIRRLVRSLAAERGIGVFISSHLLSEVELMCDRVAIIHRGRTLATGPVRELLDRPGGAHRFAVRPAALAARILGPLAESGTAEAEGEDSVAVNLSREKVPDAVRALAAAGVAIYGIERPASSLEEVFLEVTGERRYENEPGAGAVPLRVLPLVENEMLKLWKRRRFRLVLLILVALIGTIVFAQVRGREKFGSKKDWRIETQERVARMRNWVRQGRMPDSQKNWAQFEISRLQYYLDRNMDPEAVSGPLFTRGFANAASYLLLHLLSIVFAADVVSSEFSQGTIKLLLTRPVSRSRVLGSKLVALLLAIGLTVLLGGCVAYFFGGIAYGFRGWGAPILTGFRQTAGTFDASGVRAVPLWEDAIAVFGLAWFATATVGIIGFLASVLLRSTAASMGTMFAALILGTILPRLAPTWEFQKYLFPTNLPLPDYYSGSPPPIGGMTLEFSVVTLAVWAAAAIAVAFAVFTRRDVLA